MKAHTQTKKHPLGERGQSLVEMALILPFLLILVVGIVEAGVALNRQLTVVNAAREGARFGAFGATPGDIYLETKAATSQMFEFNEENTIVIVINAETNDDGTDFTEWITNTYPITTTVLHVTQAEVLAELQSGIAPADWPDQVGNLRLVVVDVRYDHESVLGLPFVGAMAGEIPIGSWTVMRLAAPRVGQGTCFVYPIGIDDDEIPDLSDADGDFVFEQTGTPGGFGWLRWGSDPNCGSANAMSNCLAEPDECLAGYDPPPHGGQCAGGYDNPSDPDDHELNEGDDVYGNSGLAAANLDDVPQNGTRIRIIVYESASGTGSGAIYYNIRFALIDVIDVTSQAGSSRLTAKFVGYDATGCE